MDRLGIGGRTGYRVLVQAWDFVPGSNWIQAHAGRRARDAARTIAVLSDAYLKSVYGGAEWQAAWASRSGRHRPAGCCTVRVTDCDRPGLLAGVVGVDLFGQTGGRWRRTRLRGKVSAAQRRPGQARCVRLAVPWRRAGPCPGLPRFPGGLAAGRGRSRRRNPELHRPRPGPR